MITKNKSLFLIANIPSLIDEVNEDISFWENVVKQYPNSYETMYPEKRMFLGNRGKYHDKYIYSVSEVLNQLNDLKEFIFNLDLEETKKELWSKMRYKQDGTFDRRNKCILIELPFAILNPKFKIFCIKSA